jgi:hypothetical protein
MSSANVQNTHIERLSSTIDVAKNAEIIQKAMWGIVRSRKARYSEKIAAAHLLAGMSGLYGNSKLKASVSAPSRSRPQSKIGQILEQAAA